MGAAPGRRSFLLAAALATAAVLAPTTAVSAQSEPRPITGLISATNLTPTDQQMIRDYADFWFAAMRDAGDDLVAGSEARAKLLEPVRSAAATEVFRSRYVDPLVDATREASRGNADLFCLVNSMIVLARIGTTNALDELVQHGNQSNEPAWQVRLAASRGAFELLSGDRLGPVKADKLQQAARRLRRCVENETRSEVLHYQLLAILATHRADLDTAARKDVFENLREALFAVSRRAATDPTLLGATDRTVADVLNKFLELGRDQQDVVGATLAPALIALLDAFAAASDAVPVGSPERRRLGSQLSRVQVRLGQLAGAAYPGRSLPRADLARVWNEGGDFRSQVDAWRAIVK